jgi:hypothetical protein
MFDYDTKEKEHQNTRQSDLRPPRTNQIATCFYALSITCSVQYFVNTIYSECLRCVWLRYAFGALRK